jgi:hypothetical protein
MSSPTVHSSYAQSLRVIGQFLDGERPEAFDLQLIDGEFVVRLRQTQPRLSWRARWHRLLAKQEKQDPERHFPLDEVAELDRSGVAQRVNSEQNPDFYRPSQTLRTIGAYVDHTSLRLSGLSRRGQRLVLRLEEPDGRNRVEEHEVSSFHNYFLQLYLKRKDQGDGPLSLR